MNCSETRDRILRSSIDDEVHAHLEQCEACSELAETDGRLAKALGRTPPPAPTPDRFAKISQITSEQDGEAVWRLRSMPTNRRISIGLCAALIGGVVCLLLLPRPDMGVYPMMRMGIVLGAMFIATAFGVVLSMPKSYKPRHPVTLRLALLIFLLLIPFIPALLPVVSHGHPASTTDMGLLKSAGACIGFGTLAAFPALIGIRLLQRESELRLWPTIYAGVAAALGANIALQAHCPIVDTGHLVVGHAMLGIVYAVLAWLVVKATVR